jgi:hypothetical protein
MDESVLRQMIQEDEFGLLNEPAKPAPVTSDDRLLASFEEINQFIDQNDREPSRSGAEVHEKKLGMRLEKMRLNPEHREALKEADRHGLLKEPEPPSSIEEALENDVLGLLDTNRSLLAPRHVPAVTTPPDRIAKQTVCEDFERFEPLFIQCHSEIKSGKRTLVPVKKKSNIRQGGFFVLRGVLVYVAEVGEEIKKAAKISDARLRCIFENGTESDLLLTSFRKGLKENGRLVTEPNERTLKQMGIDPNTPMAQVYVLRSLSDHPELAEIPDVYKIGSTNQGTKKRIANAINETTFLGAPVEVVAEWEVPAGIEKGIEGMLHALFREARIDIRFERDGVADTKAREWFSVPLPVINEAIELIETDAIVNYGYDPEKRALVLRS